MLVNRTIQTNGGQVTIFGELDEVDRIYRSLSKSMMDMGYTLHQLTPVDKEGFPDLPPDPMQDCLNSLEHDLDVVLKDFTGVMAENQQLQDDLKFERGHCTALQALLDNLTQ